MQQAAAYNRMMYVLICQICQFEDWEMYLQARRTAHLETGIYAERASAHGAFQLHLHHQHKEQIWN